ncbi:hypothetical protein [Lysinibacillus agricola]
MSRLVQKDVGTGGVITGHDVFSHRLICELIPKESPVSAPINLYTEHTF